MLYRFCPSCGKLLEKKKIDNKNRLICSACGFVFWNNPKPTTSIILPQEGKVLLLKRSQEPYKDYWVLPGGYVEYDEDPVITIVREVKEETNLNITVLRVVAVYLIDTDPRGNSVDIVYEGKIISGEIALKEHSSFQFFSQTELPELIAYRHRDVVNAWYEQQK